MTSNILATPHSEQSETNKGGKGGKGGTQITNEEFIAAVFSSLPNGAYVAVCSKTGDPVAGGWGARRSDQVIGKLSVGKNNFVGCSSFYPLEDGSFKARKSQFAGCHYLMLDDLGTKVPLDRLSDFELSWLIETSPGNHQGGIIFADPITDGEVAVKLLNSIIAAGLCDAGSTGPLSRWARLPVAINGKSKYKDKTGASFRCRMVKWNPLKRYTPAEIIAGLQLKMALAEQPKKVARCSGDNRSLGNEAKYLLAPVAENNPVVAALKAHGLYKARLDAGKHDITCPWSNEHTDGIDSGTVYFEPNTSHPKGGFKCQHSHGERIHIRELHDFLKLPISTLSSKPVIEVAQGDLHLIVDAAERALADQGGYYQAGGLIVTVSIDPVFGDPTITPISAPALTRVLAENINWVKLDSKGEIFVPIDPPARHCSIIHDSQNFKHLPTLLGVARQPYYRQSDGKLINTAGYDHQSRMYGVFDSSKFHIPEPTKAEALKAYYFLADLFNEFHFVSVVDRSAALSAIFTAVVRPTLSHAPAFHVRAPVFGSGKSFLCELVGAFAGPGRNAKVSYPTSAEEATKVILALLLSNPAVVEFDDMSSDWIPLGTILRMLTAERITDRILGVSKTATVSTRTLFLGSGNNVGPVRDLLRRVLTINIDPRCATPATMKYTGDPLAAVQKNREAYVSAVLTIISAWKKAGCPHSDVQSIVSYGGDWSDYCRHPLIWLGLPDPASLLIEQISHDPDADSLSVLMREWELAFGSRPTTVRKAVDAAEFNNPNLLDAMMEFPIEERGGINRSKLGWLIKKNANRIIAGCEFKQCTADGRVAWRVVSAASQSPSPPSPPLSQQDSTGINSTDAEIIEVEI